MKRKQLLGHLVVTKEAIEDMLVMSVSDRLAWLDQTRSFLAKTLPARIKRQWKSK
jgi:hypothetical protein